MAKKKARPDFKIEERKIRTPEVCPHCFEGIDALRIGTSDLYRCPDCGHTFAFGHFYDAWLSAHLALD